MNAGYVNPHQTLSLAYHITSNNNKSQCFRMDEKSGMLYLRHGLHYGTMGPKINLEVYVVDMLSASPQVGK